MRGEGCDRREAPPAAAPGDAEALKTRSVPTRGRALRTDEGLDGGKLIEVFQELVQGIPVVRGDGVLVLEQELGGAREKSRWQRGA